jgi:hypothetical protein
MKKNLIIIVIAILFGIQTSQAAEGMWLPFLLKEYNIEEMQQLGFKLTADDIYNINQSCLKDAVVGFVRLNRPYHHFCSGEVISNQGLVLTNHHCGIGTVQANSTEEHNYLADGFWAMNLKEELQSQNIGVCFLKRMENVSSQVLAGIKDNISEYQRDSIIQWNIDVIESKAIEGTSYKAHIDPFYGGNEYYLSVYEIFGDVRLVGAPPASIGKFGGDTDNWMWPRHTGDFTLFRIYANKDNQPADYSPDNVPYKPASHLQISLDGVKPGDFTMVLGYPGTTNEYLSSFGVELIEKTTNPITIEVRTKILDIMNDAMRNQPALRLKYTEKAAGLANTWKKRMGESRGLNSSQVVENKKAFEQQLQQWIEADGQRKNKYGGLLDSLQKVYQQMTPLEKATTYVYETLFNSDLIEFAGNFQHFLELEKSSTSEDIEKTRAQLIKTTESFFINYHQPTDKKLFTALIVFYINGVKPEWIPQSLQKISSTFKGDANAYSDWVFEETLFADKEKTLGFIKSYKPGHNKKVWKDPVFQLYREAMIIYRNKIAPPLNQLDAQLACLNRQYIQIQREFQPAMKFYPDANSTFRVCYGQVNGYKPADAVTYNYNTSLSGIIEKDNPEVYDYIVPVRIKELYQQNDFGNYANPDGTMPVCFIATNHTTGGNSGSPVLNAKGQLIGTNFDRVWEGTMSDLNYNPDICRNIALDIRYTLFIIDKFAGAGYLLDEMEIVRD